MRRAVLLVALMLLPTVAAESGEGGEVLGATAGWLLALVGATALWNLARRRYVLKALRGKKEAIKRVIWWNRKVVMPTHAVAGVLVLGLGIWHGVLMKDHWTLWFAMGGMGFLVVGGALLMWKWTPGKVRKGVYLLHAQQLLFLGVVALLLIGHAVVD